MLRHMFERRLDACFAEARLPDGVELLLFNEADAGFGDIAFATRLLGLLRRHAPAARLRLVSSRPDKQRVFGLPEGVILHGFEAFDDAASRPALAPDLVISAPGIFDHCRFPGPIYERLRIDASTPFLYLAEYGSIRQLRDDALKGRMAAVGEAVEVALDAVAERLGVDGDDMGYRGRSGEVVASQQGQLQVVDRLGDHLVAAGGPLYDWLCLPQLESRSCGVQLAEIGIHIDAELVAARPDPHDGGSAALLGGLVDANLVALGPGSAGAALYCGYAHSGVGCFLDVIAVLEQGRGRAIDVLAPNPRTPQSTWQEDFDADRVTRLRQAGVGRVLIVGNADADAPPVTVARELGAGTTLRLITCHPIANTDWRRLLLASAPPTMVTGDQSFSDAVSADKAIAIMEPVYCKTWHIDAWLAVAEATDPGLAALLRFSMAARWDEADWQTSRAFLQSGALVPAARRLNKTMVSQHDATPVMLQAICRLFWTARRPDLAAAQTALLQTAWSGFEATSGLPVDEAGLSALAALVSRFRGFDQLG